MFSGMSRPSSSLLSLVLLAGLLLGCTSAQPVYRLDARSADTSSVWVQGRQVISRTADSLQVAVAYDRTTDDGHKFRLAVANRAGSARTIDPTDVYAVVTRRVTEERHVYPAPDETGDDGTPGYEFRRDTLAVADTLWALDPEQVLLRIDRAQARAEAEAANDATTSALIATLDAVSTIAAGPQAPEERTADASEDIEYQLNRSEEQAENRRTLSRLGQRRMQWAETTLRRTTLLAGQRTAGVVYVPVDPRATRLVLHVDLGNRVVAVPFRQTRYEP